MRGIFLCSLFLILSILPAAPRRHEVQFRRNDYTVVPAPFRLQEAGLSKAFLRVFSDDEKNGGLYFSSGLFPVVRPALDLWSGAYSQSPVQLWAWMGARKFAWLGDNSLLDREWSAGKLRIIPKLDLFNPRAQELLFMVFSRLARQPVAGILIQDDLTILHGEGFSNWGMASFSRQSGLDADPGLMMSSGSAYNRVWEEVKTACVGKTLKKIVSACHEAKPGVEVGLNIHYEAPLTPGWARSWYAFDAAAVNASGVDLVYLMAYHRQMKTEMKLGESDNRFYFRRMLEAALKLWGPKLAVKLQVRDWQSSEPIPLDELKIYYGLIPDEVQCVCFAAADPEDLDLISKVIAR